MLSLKSRIHLAHLLSRQNLTIISRK